MGRALTTLTLLAAFGVGVFASPHVIGLGRLMLGDTNVRCIGATACVDAPADAFLSDYHLADRIGGVSGVFCGLSGNGEWILTADLLKGRACQQASYSVEFRTPSMRTSVSINNGVVGEIEQGPLHAIDF